MKIGETNGAEPRGLIDKIRAGEVPPCRKRIPGRADKDAVQTSDLARAFARLLGRVDESAPNPARAAQVEILRNAVATGRYAPDLHAVARKLLVDVAAECSR